MSQNSGKNQNKQYSETDIQKAARTEQLWYAATMITINGLIISQMENLSQVLNRWFIVVPSVILSIYAIGLILNRDYKYDHQEYRAPVYSNFPRNLGKAIKDFEGALFYILLVLASCIGAVFLAIRP